MIKSFIDDLKANEIAIDEKVKEQFVKNYKSIHKVDEDDALSFYEKEKTYFQQTILDDTGGLALCTPISLYSSFMEISITGLSIKKQAKAEAYIEKKSQKVKVGNVESWINVARFVIQAHGELSLRKRAGQILHAHNPIVVYDGDVFQPKTNDRGELIVEYVPKIPRESKTIIGCFVKLTLPNNIFDYKWLLKEDVERLQKISAKSMKNDNGNALYSNNDGQIDVGFLETKTLKHALGTLGKLRISSSAILESVEVIEDESFAEKKEDTENQNTGIVIKDDDSPF